MIKRDLKDNFQISISGQDTWYDMSVPGSAMDTFCKEGILPDPYYGMNEYKWTEFWKNDFDIRSTFSVSAEEIASEEILLTFYGIDTVADVFLNGKKLGHTENMHRTWVYQVKELVKEGENLLELHIASPVKFIELTSRRKEERFILSILELSLEASTSVKHTPCLAGTGVQSFQMRDFSAVWSSAALIMQDWANP